MNKVMAQKIAEDHLKPGKVYMVKTAIGEVFGRLLNKKNLEFEITAGMLRSRATQKTWSKGQNFCAPIGSEFYETL